ncbi:MAG: adenylate cyclase [Granulosicoccus sp.]|jgi:adenylate cyclase
MTSVSRKLVAILAADIAGYSALMDSNEARTVADLKAHHVNVLPLLTEHNGRLIATGGDGILAEFASVVNALDCAITIQRAMAQRNALIEVERHMQFRMGINIGDVIYDADNIYGDGINIAARLEGISEPGAIYISHQVYEQVMGKVDSTFDDLGYRKVKNISQSVHVYRVRFEVDAQLNHPAAFPSSGLVDQPLFDLDGSSLTKNVTTTGRCLCGDVVLEITEPAIGTGVCHCKICQRFCGAPIHAWAAFLIEAVRFKNNKPKYYNSSGIAKRGFCANCGSSLTYRLLKPQLSKFLVISIASLDEPENFAPTWHGGIESQMSWLDINDGLPRTKSEDSPALCKAWESIGVIDPSKWK